MDIELYALLSTVILVSTIITLVFALFSYMAFRYRQNGIQRSDAQPDAQAKPKEQALFFRRYERAGY